MGVREKSTLGGGAMTTAGWGSVEPARFLTNTLFQPLFRLIIELVNGT